MKKYVILTNDLTILIEADDKMDAINIFKYEYDDLFCTYDFTIKEVFKTISEQEQKKQEKRIDTSILKNILNNLDYYDICKRNKTNFDESELIQLYIELIKDNTDLEEIIYIRDKYIGYEYGLESVSNEDLGGFVEHVKEYIKNLNLIIK